MKDISFKKKIKSLVTAASIMILGLVMFKYIPMHIWGDDILFDASAHITGTIFVLYVFWYFIDQNKSWRIPYLLVSTLILFAVAIQRILASAHDSTGIILGLAISLMAITISRRDYFKGKFDF